MTILWAAVPPAAAAAATQAFTHLSDCLTNSLSSSLQSCGAEFHGSCANTGGGYHCVHFHRIPSFFLTNFTLLPCRAAMGDLHGQLR